MELCWPTWRSRWPTWENFGSILAPLSHLGTTFFKNIENLKNIEKPSGFLPILGGSGGPTGGMWRLCWPMLAHLGAMLAHLGAMLGYVGLC